ncbi:hypothetical protein KP509_32G059800 [Ceratopteris richardii]|uniref:Receptor-like serine/threonine-protein kinase n=1 Tax=Ceratopteris richardii TaxID=49495 RepID=A0A8T2QV78_CERRI|nr:hypothetical protein KP509_32G059800 [Ceratopteris richardii]KAH7287520.1 hypothetical protein KP509_32G059800 [Ceratopteris richardii]KAH7287521.1 hypothetical protein KP509_32G059800 [Ceratopteris richardii]
MLTQAMPVSLYKAVIILLVANNARVICLAQNSISHSLETEFRLSPNDISVQWNTFKPFLSSSNGVFVLGFEGGGREGYVLAIMYIIRYGNESVSSEVVWSANPHSPGGKDVTFALDEQGNATLTDPSKGTLWSSHTSSSSASAALSIEDSGNLILFSSSATGKSILWQSFQHPTDTLLEGQNFTAGMSLTALMRPLASEQVSVFVKMDVDGIGFYTDLGRNASSMLYWNFKADQETGIIDPTNSTLYARMGDRGFLAMYEAGEERVSLSVFKTYNSSTVLHRRMKLDTDGNLRVYYWENTSWQVDFEVISEDCSLPSVCGSYGICRLGGECACAEGHVLDKKDVNATFGRLNESNPREGCLLEEAESYSGATCSSGKPSHEDLFVQLVGVDSLYHQAITAPWPAAGNVSTVDECEQLCREDCACTGFFYNVATKCFLAYDTAAYSMVQTGKSDYVAFLRLSSAANFSMASLRAPTFIHVSGGVSRVAGVIIAAVVLTCVVVLILSVIVARNESRARLRSTDIEKKAFLSETPGVPPFIHYGILESATLKFSRPHTSSQIGSIYAGTLPSGSRVAITLFTVVNQVDWHEIKLHLASVGRISHPNIASLCGYSVQGDKLAVCYKKPSGSILNYPGLDWQQRVSVALGVARALAAIHAGRLVHGLLGLEEVFIGDGGAAALEVKLGWLGVAELVKSGLVVASNISPPSNLTEAEDVLRLGMLLSELFTRKRVKDSELEVWRLRWRDSAGGEDQELLDSAIAADANTDVLSKLTTSIRLCLHPSPLQRPSMYTIVQILEGSSSSHLSI